MIEEAAKRIFVAACAEGVEDCHDGEEWESLEAETQEMYRRIARAALTIPWPGDVITVQLPLPKHITRWQVSEDKRRKESRFDVFCPKSECGHRNVASEEDIHIGAKNSCSYCLYEWEIANEITS
jgi:hypothetical protein